VVDTDFAEVGCVRDGVLLLGSAKSRCLNQATDTKTHTYTQIFRQTNRHRQNDRQLIGLVIMRRNRFLQHFSVAWSVCLSVVCHIRASCLNRRIYMQFSGYTHVV